MVSIFDARIPEYRLKKSQITVTVRFSNTEIPYFFSSNPEIPDRKKVNPVTPEKYKPSPIQITEKFLYMKHVGS